MKSGRTSAAASAPASASAVSLDSGAAVVSSFFSVVSGFLSVVTGALTVVSGFFSGEGSALFLWEITDMLIRIARTASESESTV